MKEYFGKQRVTHTDFKREDVTDTYGAVVNYSKKMTHKCFEQLKYLLNGEQLDSERKKKLLSCSVVT